MWFYVYAMEFQMVNFIRQENELVLTFSCLLLVKLHCVHYHQSKVITLRVAGNEWSLEKGRMMQQYHEYAASIMLGTAERRSILLQPKEIPKSHLIVSNHGAAIFLLIDVKLAKNCAVNHKWRKRERGGSWTRQENVVLGYYKDPSQVLTDRTVKKSMHASSLSILLSINHYTSHGT